MALADLTKQLAKEALLSAAADPPAATPPPGADSMGNIILGQVKASLNAKGYAIRQAIPATQ